MDALTAAGFAYDAQCLAFMEFIRYAVDRVNDTLLSMKSCDEVFNLHHNGLCQNLASCHTTAKGFFYKQTNGLLFFRNSYEIAKFLTANGLLAQLLHLTNGK